MQQDSPFECRFNGHLPVREERERTTSHRPRDSISWWDAWIGWPARPIVTGRKTVFWYSNSALLSNEKFGSLEEGPVSRAYAYPRLTEGDTFRCG